MRSISMIGACEVSKEPGIQGVCGLLGKENIAGGDHEGFIFAVREIVEHFHITWGATPLYESDSGESVQIGFVLELNGAHEPAADHIGRTCRHCANLMLALRIVGDWLFPPEGKCPSCELQAYCNFIRGDQMGQPEACSTRVIRLASHLGTRCQLGSCHVWCETTLRERLNRIGSVERGTNSVFTEKKES
jgi:hypothetical protein